jgi:hypothetical protein
MPRTIGAERTIRDGSLTQRRLEHPEHIKVVARDALATVISGPRRTFGAS